MTRDARSEINQMNMALRDHQRSWGSSVSWFEYNTGTSSRDAIYEEGPSRQWFPPIILPVTTLFVRQGPPVEPGEGLYLVQSATLTFQVSEASDRFRVDPLQAYDHFKDRFAYRSTIYLITSYEKTGLVQGTFMTISVRGAEVKDDELQLDTQNSDFYSQEMTW